MQQNLVFSGAIGKRQGAGTDLDETRFASRAITQRAMICEKDIICSRRQRVREGRRVKAASVLDAEDALGLWEPESGYSVVLVY